MGRKTYNSKQINEMLKCVMILLNQGVTLCVACRKTGISEQTYYRWRRKFRGPVNELRGIRIPVPLKIGKTDDWSDE